MKVTISFWIRQTHSERNKVIALLAELQASGKVKTVGDNECYTRVVQNENKVKVVKQMPKIVQAKQPTIAIITAQYCEKLAVDAMMDDQETFVRYTTVGKSNVSLSCIDLSSNEQELFFIQVNPIYTLLVTLATIESCVPNFRPLVTPEKR